MVKYFSVTGDSHAIAVMDYEKIRWQLLKLTQVTTVVRGMQLSDTFFFLFLILYTHRLAENSLLTLHGP